MKILFLTQILPYPPDAGPKVKTWHVLNYLKNAGHEIFLATFIRPEEEPHILQVEKICQQVHPIPIKRSRVSDVWYFFRSLLTGRPFLIERDDIQAMRAVVNQVIEYEQIDVIHADQLTMTQFCLPRIFPRTRREKSSERGSASRSQPVLIFDAHNAVWTIVERMRENAAWFLKPLAQLEAWRIKRYEGAVLSTFHHTLAVSEVDSQSLSEAANEFSSNGPFDTAALSVIPIVIDTDKIQAVTLPENSLEIVTLGSLHYPPNADGIRWFLNEVFPLITAKLPGVHLTIIGKNPPQDFLSQAAERPAQVTVTGYVPDLTPYFNQTAVIVIPVRAGGGMRVRILEAFAYGIPVVTTTIGLEGIDADPGKEVLVADTAADYAESVLRILRSPEEQLLIARAARQLVEQKYDWEVALQKIPAIYHQYVDKIRTSLVPNI